MKVLFVEYPKCSTCKKAKKWLDDNNIEYTYRNIKEQNPTCDEIKKWHDESKIPLRKFFNTSGLLYRSENIKEKLTNMNEDEIIKTLASDGMMVKRPIVIYENTVLVGFKEAEWSEKLLENK